jgi:hypothetical protein
MWFQKAESLAAELVSGGRQEAGESRVAIPVGQLRFAGGMDGAVDGGHEEVLTHGEALAAFGDVLVDEGNQVELLSQLEEGCHRAEGGDGHRLGLGQRLGLGSGQEFFQGAEVDGFDDLGLAVDPLTLPEVVIGASANDFGSETGHPRTPCHQLASSCRTAAVIRSYDRPSG